MEYAPGASSEGVGLLESFWPRMTREVQNLASVRFRENIFFNFFFNLIQV